MKFPYSMLLDFVDTRLSAEGVGDLLTMAGFELEGIEEVDGEPVLDIKVMSNRGDGLSVFGLAREVLAKDPHAKATPLYGHAIGRFQNLVADRPKPKTSVTVETDDCTRYACLILNNLTEGESETWMQRRLIQAGMRPISLLVDATNYVVLELGQPLHAFDYDKLAEGRIVVRKAHEGEKLTTLNGIEHDLSPDQMMICDGEKPVAAAGIMGGLDSEVSNETSTVLLESAHFLNTSVRRTRKQLGLSTEASYRFERSVDPDGVVAAMLRYVQLVQTADASIEATGVIDVFHRKPEPRSIRLRIDRASLLLGMDVTADQAESYLERLGFQMKSTGTGEWSVVPPNWRPDIVREEDLVEELGRVHGYEKIPERRPEGTTTQGGPQGLQLWTDLLREATLRAGFSQIVSHSLRDLHPLDDSQIVRLGPRTPASPETAYLRNSLLPSLSDAARRNNPKEIALFELGQIFGNTEQGYMEQGRLAFLSTGAVQAGGWKLSASGSSDFFTLKGAVDSIFDHVGVVCEYEPPYEPDPRLHPTRQAKILAQGSVIGFIGQLHPDVATQSGLQAETFVAEVVIGDAYANRNQALKLHSVSRQPSVRRDMSILIDKVKTYDSLAAKIEEAAGDVLEKQWLFDVFSGTSIPEGKHALGIALQFRKSDSTFTDEEANQVRDRVVEALAVLGATMR